jgi:hypothetical protein
VKSIYGKACVIGLFLCVATITSSLAADKTWTGAISDSNCGASHAKMIRAHGATTGRDCTLACVKAGAKYVFLMNGKVYNIANQDFAGLPAHADDTVMLTGTLDGDTITVSKVCSGPCE